MKVLPLLVLFIGFEMYASCVVGQSNLTGDGSDKFPEDLVTEMHPSFMEDKSRPRRFVVSYSQGFLSEFGETISSSIGFRITRRIQLVFTYSPGGSFVERKSDVFFGQNATLTTTVSMPTVYLSVDYVVYDRGFLDFAVRGGMYRTSYHFRSKSEPSEINNTPLNVIPSDKNGTRQSPYLGMSAGVAITDRVSLRLLVASQSHKFTLPNQQWLYKTVEAPTFPKGGLLVQGSLHFLAF
jgi:hypothetical protein